MIEEAKVNFYRINKCGYYERGNDINSFGGIENILDQLFRWASQDDFTLNDSCTYEVLDDDQILRTFCCNLINEKNTGDYLLTTWNETPSNEGRVASIEANSTLGHSTVHMNALPEGTIPGYATYFWFLPQNNIFATIRFGSRTLNGHKNLVKYLNGFLDVFSDHVVKEEDPAMDGHYAVHGYRDLLTGEVTDTLYPAFASSPIRNPGEINYIKDNRVRIRKMIRKTTLDVNVQAEVEFYQRLLNRFGLGEPPAPDMHAKIEYNMPFEPGTGELDEIIDNWNETAGGTWNDIGFKMEGDPQPKWLSNSLAKASQTVDIEKDNDEVINAESLLGALIENRDAFLEVIEW
ncbi:hypothetical protein [Desulfuromonas acetoxidans]|uniref:Uncharacterized protein n=1 Tax=Desulfuromonas acetoxidans (strain DSM 684 / 11070) TaxID=281689 RepID=Q1JWY8_DESA6|nr:hypothetical protein [Desulfuromonas acetoxidans]EAT14770.1 hypothetical protein Dace_0824 [Desulfuromonas acetoxidans DSM 684]MBF0645844.1 hypothetical protein [Desulfuromonas acetoxidans]NVD25024.1 hypothetical protein [Desulfuromonas acetoxidans]NVE17069.1 hypothetical protein [Desulfuromonas acetoxidans]